MGGKPRERTILVRPKSSPPPFTPKGVTDCKPKQFRRTYSQNEPGIAITSIAQILTW
jgi:hypothetical protein